MPRFLMAHVSMAKDMGAVSRRVAATTDRTLIFVLFDVKVGDWWLQRESVEDVSAKLGLDIVPIIGRGTLADFVEMGRAGFNSRWGAFAAEGLVGRPGVELKARNGNRIITKIKTKDFSDAS
jgi:hypothetical protein